jgi:hypothetical protein
LLIFLLSLSLSLEEEKKEKYVNNQNTNFFVILYFPILGLTGLNGGWSAVCGTGRGLGRWPGMSAPGGAERQSAAGVVHLGPGGHQAKATLGCGLQRTCAVVRVLVLAVVRWCVVRPCLGLPVELHMPHLL